MVQDAMFPQTVFTIWWIGLIVTLVVFVPLAVVLLHQTWRAARSIQIYAQDALQAAVGIAGNTKHIPALETTIQVGGDMLNVAGAAADKLGTVADVLAKRAG